MKVLALYIQHFFICFTLYKELHRSWWQRGRAVYIVNSACFAFAAGRLWVQIHLPGSIHFDAGSHPFQSRVPSNLDRYRGDGKLRRRWKAGLFDPLISRKIVAIYIYSIYHRFVSQYQLRKRIEKERKKELRIYSK
jgi:hypothetical protein